MEDKFYRLIIPNERYKYVKPFQVSILTVNAVLLAVVAFYQNELLNFTWTVLLLLSVLIVLYGEKLNRYRFFRKTNFSETGFLWAIAGWVFVGNLWIAFAVALAALAQGFVKKDYEYLFSVNEIEMNIFPHRTIHWYELQNVVLKDGVLTIDFKNNKINQSEISTQQSNSFNEAEFNEFCRSQLAANG